MATTQYELLSQSETLELKLGLWQRKLRYAKGAMRDECERAISDITMKLASHSRAEAIRDAWRTYPDPTYDTGE